MDRGEKKSDRIPVSNKTRIRLKKYYVNEGFKNYDEAINVCNYV
jgi:hypothetical protein